jgi:hypothetical protein
MLIDNPFVFTPEDVLFESWSARQNLGKGEQGGSEKAS